MVQKLRISWIIILLLSSLTLLAQDSLVFEKYVVDNFYLNNKLIEESSPGHYISFVQKDSAIFFVNGYQERGTYSMGKISEIEESRGTYKIDGQTYNASRSHFVWDYKNSYDDAKGVAEVEFTKTFYEKHMSFELIISLENKDTTALYGFAKYTIPEDKFILPIKGEWISLTPLLLDKTSIGLLGMYDSNYHRSKDSLWTTSGSIFYNRVNKGQKTMEQTNFDYYIDINNISIIVTGSDVLKGLSRYNLKYELIDHETLVLEYNGQKSTYKRYIYEGQ